MYIFEHRENVRDYTTQPNQIVSNMIPSLLLIYTCDDNTNELSLALAKDLSATFEGEVTADNFKTPSGHKFHSAGAAYLDSASGASVNLRAEGNSAKGLEINSSGNLIAPGVNATGSTSNRYPLYWVHTGTVGGIEKYTGSVRAMKKDIADMGSVDWINSLRPRSFKFRDFEDIDGVRTYKDTTNDNPITEYGLIAEEVDEVEGSDYIVDKDSDGKVKGVLYHNLVPILLKALQEQNERIKALENA